jgi:predicted nucleic acid-binding protein
MQEENLVFHPDIEGILDVGVIVPSCFENPLKEESARFLQDVLVGRKKALIPISAVLGAYHILTSYLGVSRMSAKDVLSGLLETGSDALYHGISIDLASRSLDYAVAYNVESWDGYLIALARKSGAKVLFSMDEELAESLKKEEGGLVVATNPFTADKVKQYHKFLERKEKATTQK